MPLREECETGPNFRREIKKKYRRRHRAAEAREVRRAKDNPEDFQTPSVPYGWET